MDSDENREPQNPQPPKIQFSMKPIYLISILVLFLAISFGILTKTIHFPPSLLKPANFPHPKFFQEILRFNHFTSVIRKKEIREPPHCLLWMAPFLSGGGYSSEAWSYILALNSYIKSQKTPFLKLSIEQHGDHQNVEFWEGLPLEMKNLALELHQSKCRLNETVVVCHSEPGAWYPPPFQTLPCPLNETVVVCHSEPGARYRPPFQTLRCPLNETVVVCHSEPGAWYPPLFQTRPCPPTGYGQFKVVVGRTMFETDRVNDEHVRRCNRMDFVWVPTDFHVRSFRQSGVDPAKVRKIIQPVDLAFFDPFKVEALDLDAVSSLVLGSRELISEGKFVFLSVFKWEYRKGWDVLLRSYLQEFSGVDDVALCLLTNAYHTGSDFASKIVEFVEGSALEQPVNGWAPVYVIDGHIAQVDLPRLYKAANAFVLPSRGEGWGRPVVEAMAMSLPVITTNWSGPTEYLTDENSYPLPYDGMSEVKDGPFKGHLWAEPSVDELRFLMRRVMSNPGEAKARGLQARLDMKGNFSPEIVAKEIVDHLQEIVDNLH